MEFILAPLKYVSHQEKLVEMLVNLETDNDTDREHITAGIIGGFFEAYRRDICFRYRALVGAAAAIVAQAPKHNGDCECQTCFLKWTLEDLIMDGMEVRARELSLADDWIQYRNTVGGGPGKPNPILEPIRREALEKEMSRLLQEHAQALKERQY